jgi:hypothetical protein
LRCSSPSASTAAEEINTAVVRRIGSGGPPLAIQRVNIPVYKKAVSKVLAEARDCLISGITLPE